MNKKIVIAGLSLGVLAGLHTTFWFYQSGKIKASIEQAASQISKEIGNKNTEFFYTSSNITGFPLNFAVNINQPKFVSAAGGEKLEVSSGDETLVITSNLLGNSYKVKLPAKIDIKHNVDDKESNYKLEFSNEAPVLSLKFSESLLFAEKEVPEFVNYWSERLKSLQYNDSGYLVSNIDGDKKIASSDSSSLNVTRTRDKAKVYSEYNIKVQNMDNSALWSLEEKPAATTPATDAIADTAPTVATLGIWPLNANIDFSSSDMRDSSGKTTNVIFAIKQADISSSSFGFDIKGEIKADGDDIFPFGGLNIKITSYQNMVDYFSGIVSKAFAESKIPLFQIKSEKSMNFKKVLSDISTEKSNENNDILLTISREKGKNLFIGQKGLMEVIDLLKNSSNAGTIEDDAGSAPVVLEEEVPATDSGLPVIVPSEIE